MINFETRKIIIFQVLKWTFINEKCILFVTNVVIAITTKLLQ